MAELKTKQTGADAASFLNTIEDEKKRKDCFEILQLMQHVTGLPPKMWGTAIIGFGSYHYKYESGHEGDMCIIGMSPRKQNITLYLDLTSESIQQLLPQLGKHKTGKGCLYINKFSDVKEDMLKKIVESAWKNGKKK